jgi:hypothetical protein
MKVVDHSDAHWILFADEGRLLLDVNCSHSFFSYEFLMVLNETECARYKDEGRDYLDRLADDIQYSAPGLLVSKSEYKTRSIHAEMRDATTEAFTRFRNEKTKEA